ncbi:HAD-IA family hydrolase [Burkholderia sp. Ac-20344]|uniref:HAD family hydrolase n=1 Tax=Burkholderia sp. Ac-20344 TaxID=2703890 RepID=UPI00197CB495|nr:HAD-IA family hydrolase [Burkholderia sp. Ac-20344]MBN3833714.1 HAD family hydrolase [Burkholderia sp. Ac-20344]
MQQSKQCYSAGKYHRSPESIRYYSVRRGRSLLEQVSLPETQRSEIISEIAAEFRRLESEALLFDGAHESIIQLREINIPLGIFTGRDRASLHSKLENLSLIDKFSSIIFRNEAPSKPNPAGLHILKKNLNAKQLIFIGNSLDDQTSASAAGCNFIAAGLCQRVREPQIPPNSTTVAMNFAEIMEHLARILGYTPKPTH